MDFANILKFLKELGKNNDREWFTRNKDRYTRVKGEFDLIVASLLEEMTKFDTSLSGLDPKKLTFRIYRDVRFSKDKSPYKRNMSAAFSSAGKGLSVPGYYFHIEPGNKSMVGIGLYMPEAANVTKIRQEIDYNGTALEKVFKERKFKKYFGEFWDEDKLKTAPKGYEKDHKHLDWLRLKSFIVSHSFKDSEVVEKKFLKNAVDVLKSAKPLNDFLAEAIS
jgi:uncharacterized protein (TIGR02453 family)